MKKPLKIPFFGEHCFPIEIYFCANEVQWHSLLKDRGIQDEPYPDSDARCTRFDFPGRISVCILTICGRAEERNSVEVLGMLVHELIHAKQHVEYAMYGDNSGRGAGRLDIETEAYLMQKLLMWIVNAYADNGRKFEDG